MRVCVCMCSFAWPGTKCIFAFILGLLEGISAQLTRTEEQRKRKRERENKKKKIFDGFQKNLNEKLRQAHELMFCCLTLTRCKNSEVNAAQKSSSSTTAAVATAVDTRRSKKGANCANKMNAGELDT